MKAFTKITSHQQHTTPKNRVFMEVPLTSFTRLYIQKPSNATSCAEKVAAKMAGPSKEFRS
jgi:hypothetical protein